MKEIHKMIYHHSELSFTISSSSLFSPSFAKLYSSTLEFQTVLLTHCSTPLLLD